MEIEIEKATLLLLLGHENKGMEVKLILFDCWCLQLTVPLHIYKGRSRPVPMRFSIVTMSLNG
jgi:hypothetical protein